MFNHLPILQVALPLIAAPVCSLLPNRWFSWAWATFISLCGFIISVILLHHVWQHNLIRYELGGWIAPYGIEYRIDLVNALVLFVISGITLIVAIYSFTSCSREIPSNKISYFYTAYLLCYAGLLGICTTGDTFNVFVFLEISSLSTYALIAMGKDPRCLTASFRYLVMGTIGATFILIAIGLIYMMTGTLNMADLARLLPEISDKRTIHAAFAFLTVGIGLKMALFPLHRWLPNAYTFAPSAVTAFLAATATKVALYLLLRFAFTIFGSTYSFQVLHLDYILLPLSLIAILVASTSAIFNSDAKRLLAFSSIAQIGYMTLAISLNSQNGLTSALLHLFNHALMKGGLFLSMGCIVYRIGNSRIESLAGIGHYMPFTFAAFVAGGLSLIGVPLTVGFISKWMLLRALLEKGNWGIALMVLFASLLAVIYIWKIIETAWFKKRDDELPVITEAPLSLLIPTWFLILLNFYFGIHTEFTINIATQASILLLGGSS